MGEDIKYVLSEDQMPEAWYNIQADLPEPLPPVLHPGTKQPVTPEDLAPLFAQELIKQEVSQERTIEIPEEVRDVYRQWRPSPLYRARRLEQMLDTPAKIYYKNEAVSPAGSHKPNTAIAQAYYNKQEGITRLSTETGAGQWGSALSLAASFFDMEVVVYMVKVSYNHKPYRRIMIETYGGRVIASPSEETDAGRTILAEDPDSPGSLGIAIGEAVEIAIKDERTNYALGSVLNHVMLHQTIIGIESMAQMEMADDYPDIVIGCVGGGSNFAGIAFPYIGNKLRGGRDVRIIAVEPAICPTLTRGAYAYDYGDTAHLTPLVKMYTLGSRFMPPPIHAGGLRYHGMAPLVSHVHKLGLVEARSETQLECLKAGMDFARAEGIIPAPEATHAVKATIDEALRCKEEGVSKTILFNLSGHGHFDMQAYLDYQEGRLQNVVHSDEALVKSLQELPQVDM
jgi:tryptophan synthase beta chain